MTRNEWGKVGIGFLLGSIGLTALGSKPAQKLYTHITAGAFMAKDFVMEKTEKIQATASDIADDAKAITEKYYAEKDDEFDQGIDADAKENGAEENYTEA